MFLKLLNQFSKLLEENSKIFGIIVFGSSTKGKKDPKDIDVCAIFREKTDLKLIKKILELGNIDVIYFTIDDFFSWRISCQSKKYF